ncbi:MAG: NADH-quinone oxidoreductase subunit M, partial [Alphaproteobacteria bacterium]|nr:NADH-quinone oxidoreductase subunit M [Alphaproteobacteria bacterium]
AVVYIGFVALAQQDMKKLIAYSSIAHMGFVTLGLFSFNAYGIEGAVFQMISHGLISAGLFLCIGMLYNRLHTREIKRFGGIINNMPNFAVVFMIFTLGAISLPGTSGFVGEFLSILGAYKISTCMGIFAASGMVLGATYMLILYRRVFLGPQDNIDTRVLEDINIREKLILLPVIALILYLGIYPNVILDKISAPAINIAKLYSEPIAEAELTPYPRINNIGGEEK